MDAAQTPDPVDLDPVPVDPEAERVIDEDEAAEALPEELDAPFEEPIPDVIDQRRVVVLDPDDYDA